MSNKLYVGNISFTTDENALGDLFSQFGTVKSVKIITDRETGRSKGFGFVEMSDSSEAEAAIANLDGKDAGGRNIRVNIAEDKPRERSFGGGGSRGGGDRGGFGGGRNNRR